MLRAFGGLAMTRALRARNATCYREQEEDVENLADSLSDHVKGTKKGSLLTTRQSLQRGAKGDRQQEGPARDQVKHAKQTGGNIRGARQKAPSPRCGACIPPLHGSVHSRPI